MKFYLFLILFSIIQLLFINFFLKKTKFCLDKEKKNETHKSLLRDNILTPLSGTFYFYPIILILFFKSDPYLVIFSSLFFLLGLFADLKFVDSYKLRLVFQFFFLFIFIFVNKDFLIQVRIDFIDNLMNYEVTRILICVFFFMVLINGFNLIDGTNCLCSLNFLLISFFIFLISKNLNIDYVKYEIMILLIPLLIFVGLNFFGYNFLGDGAAYGIGFFLGMILVKIAMINNTISPYFIANLLWYPAFENLFSIIRRSVSNKNNYLPDNNHLHHLIFKYFKKKFFTKKDYLLSSLVGLSINTILLIGFTIGYNNLNSTIKQIIIILSGVVFYLLTYYFLTKKINKSIDIRKF